MLTFNEYQRELQKRINDPQLAYILTYLYECVIEINKQLDEAASVLLSQARAMEQISLLRAEDVEQIKRLTRKVDGVEVHSVAHDPNDV